MHAAPHTREGGRQEERVHKGIFGSITSSVWLREVLPQNKDRGRASDIWSGQGTCCQP